MTEPPHPAQELKERILDAAKQTPSLARRAVVARTAIVMASSIAVGAGLFVLVGGVRIGPRPLALIVGTALGSGFIAFVAAWGALGGRRSMLGRPRLILLAIAIATPVALFAWKVSYSSLYPGMLDAWPTRPGLKCFGLTIGTGLLPLVALAFARRRTDPTHPEAVGAALGGAVGACSSTFVDLWCPVAYPPHVIIGHFLPVLTLAIIGAWLGRLVISIRQR